MPLLRQQLALLVQLVLYHVEQRQQVMQLQALEVQVHRPLERLLLLMIQLVLQQLQALEVLQEPQELQLLGLRRQ